MFGLAIHDEESRCSLLSVKRAEINDSIHRISVVDERSNVLWRAEEESMIRVVANSVE